MRPLVARESLELVIENGYDFKKTRARIIENDIEDDVKSWFWTCLNEDALQLLPIDIKSISHPTPIKCSIYRDSYYPPGKAYLPQYFDEQPHVRTGASTVRFLVFGKRLQHMLVIAVITNIDNGGLGRGRTHKAYLRGQSWIQYGMPLKSPTMGFKIPDNY